METKHTATVAVITPVYNGGPFLQECIDSVLSQTYGDFEYFIVDNCSTDETLAIARKAAGRDERVTVIENEHHVGPIQNWNRSLHCADANFDYVKFVHADDWLFPECLERMVALAETNDRIGLVSAYRLEEDQVSLDRLPADAPLVAGKDHFTLDGRRAARAILYERSSVLGSPSSILFRASLLWSESADFFCEKYLHADKEACLRLLQWCDLGFIRQVLTFTRRHNESVTSLTNVLDTRRQENLLLLKQYGPVFLSEAEFELVSDWDVRIYYDFLAKKAGTGIGREFWRSHARILEAAGHPFRRSQLAYAVLRRWANPWRALKEFLSDRSSSGRKLDPRTVRFLDASRRQPRPEDEQRA